MRPLTHGKYLLDTCTCNINSLSKYGEIRWQLERKGQKIGDMDLFIAATALEEDLIVVTGNINHFNRIDGLKVENWMEQ